LVYPGSFVTIIDGLNKSFSEQQQQHYRIDEVKELIIDLKISATASMNRSDGEKLVLVDSS